MKKTNIQKLRNWLQSLKLKGIRIIPTSDIYKWGVKNYSTRASRDARDLAKYPYDDIRRLNNNEYGFYGINSREKYYFIN